MYRIYLSRSMRDLNPEPFSFQSPPQKLPDSVQWRQYTSIFILVLLSLEIVAIVESRIDCRFTSLLLQVRGLAKPPAIGAKFGCCTVF